MLSYNYYFVVKTSAYGGNITYLCTDHDPAGASSYTSNANLLVQDYNIHMITIAIYLTHRSD